MPNILYILHTFGLNYRNKDGLPLLARASGLYVSVVNIFEPDREVVDRKWPALRAWLDKALGCGDDLEGVLFLVGLQELRQEFAPDLDKASKQRIINEGTYSVLESLGCFERIGQETDGYWIWEPHEDFPDNLSSSQQELLLRAGILSYFDRYLNP